MGFKHFNLGNVKRIIKSSQNNHPKNPERRKFVKAMGFGMLAANPIIKTFNTFTDNSYSIVHHKNSFSVIRDGKVVWGISPEYFGKQLKLDVRQTDSKIYIKAKKLQVVHTNFGFDMEAVISKDTSNWMIHLKIPQLDIDKNIDFNDWITLSEEVQSTVGLNTELIRLNTKDCINLNGKFTCKINADWDIQLQGESGVQLQLNEHQINANQLLITADQEEFEDVLQGKLTESVRLHIEGKQHWERVLKNIELDDNHSLHVAGDTPAVNFSLGKTQNKETLKTLWVSEQQGHLTYAQMADAGAGVLFSKYFYLADYTKGAKPEFYLTAKMDEREQWLTNSIGSFQLNSDKSTTELELFGTGTRVTRAKLEPRFKAFQPRIEGAVGLPTLQNNLKISLASGAIAMQQLPTKKKKKTARIKADKTNQPLLKATTKKVEYRSTAPIRLKVLRPEDMVYLEFEFHNFKIVGKALRLPDTNVNPIKTINPIKRGDLSKPVLKDKNVRSRNIVKRTEDVKIVSNPNIADRILSSALPIQGIGISSKLALADPNKKGTVIIHFPTQHTLEEAFYETNAKLENVEDLKNDSSNPDRVTLPARHIRAQRSRLVYEMKAKSKAFALSMEELLDWSKFTLKVDPRAYIKLKTIDRLAPQEFKLANKPKYNSNNKVKYLNKKDMNYGVVLAKNNKITAKKDRVYETSELNKVLPAKLSTTLKPSFNIIPVRMIPKVEAIDKKYTSIEAPALLYISPNQVNDFLHKTKVDETSVFSEYSISKGPRVIQPLRVNRAIHAKPISRYKLDKYALTPTGPGTITELWHTHLGVKLKNGKTTRHLDRLKTIRALWAYDANSKYDANIDRNAPFRASLDANNRHKLVHLTSNYSFNNYKPTPVPVKKLILSNLGAYLDWHVFFKAPESVKNTLNVVEWEHQATLGRDHYVKIVEEGYLFPFGHRAAIVTITERKFDAKTKAAVNKQRKYIVVLQDRVTYDRNDPKNKFIEFPFQEVRITTTKTPNIDAPEESELDNAGGKLNFMVKVSNRGFAFDMIVTDKEGSEKFLRMPLAFVENVVGTDETSLMSNIIKAYNDYDTAYTDIDMSGQDIAYAESFIDGDTSFETQSLLFGATAYPGSTYQIKFHPVMQSSQVFIDAVDKITSIRKPIKISMVDDHNKGEIFAKVYDAVLDFAGGSESGGGFVSPNMPINALSKLQGAVSGELDKLKNLMFEPSKVFGKVDQVVDGMGEVADALDNLPLGKIFGVIDLAALFLDLDTGKLQQGLQEFKAGIDAIKQQIEAYKNKILYYENLAKQSVAEIETEFNNIRDLINTDVQAEIDAFIQEQVNTIQEAIKAEVVKMVNKLAERAPKIPNLKTYVTETAFFAEYKYQPEFESTNIEIFPELLNVTVTNPKEALTINTTIEKPFELAKPPSVKTSARFDNFGIDIVPLLKVNFNYLEFKTGSSSKTDVKVDMNKETPIEFKGALSFVNSLQDLIPSGGFSDDGPYVDLSITGVKAGFNISIPNVEVGVCMITNIALGAYVNLPFTGAPLTLGFNFCTRENPFLLTISAFGGGGFFLMVTTLEGIQSMEAAFEFGAAMSMNVGVASGSVSVMGGFYFKMELIDKTVNGVEKEVSSITLTGYLRMNGRLSILGLITVSLEFYLALNAIIVDGKVEKMEGTATVKVKIEILFFSKTVSVTVRRELKGADADPKFAEMIEEDDWQEYCLAFAS